MFTVIYLINVKNILALELLFGQQCLKVGFVVDDLGFRVVFFHFLIAFMTEGALGVKDDSVFRVDVIEVNA